LTQLLQNRLLTVAYEFSSETSNVQSIVGSLGSTSVGAEAFAQLGLKKLGFDSIQRGYVNPTAIKHFV
jgi:hypothetical protein